MGGDDVFRSSWDECHNSTNSMKTKLIMFLASLVLILTAFPAKAQLFEEITSDQLQSIMKDQGYGFEVDEDGDLIWRIEGVRALLMRSEDGENIMFRMSFANDKTTLAKVNKWNQTKRYSRSYLDEDGDPVLELDLDLAGGVTKARIIDYLTTCRLSFAAWSKEVL